MKLAIVGVTGLVGRKMLQVLEEKNFCIEEFFPVASKKSCGKTINFRGSQYEVIDIASLLEKDVDVALFSAGSSVSKEAAPLLARKGTFVIDNSSAWRMNDDVPLVVPEINPHTINKNTKIISNPNCSTIQLVMPLFRIHKRFVIKRIVVSTYQSVTGTGKNAVDQLNNEIRGIEAEKVYPYDIFLNCLPHCDIFLENGYTKEEMKLVNETKKILGDNSIKITATAVRIPVVGGHSESVNIETEKFFELKEIYDELEKMPGVVVWDDIKENKYPMPIIAQDKDDVFVGRIRRDFSVENGVNMWIVADNLRKGAATNAVQILEILKQKKLLSNDNKRIS